MQLLILGRMMQISLTIDGLKLEVEEGLTILEAAQRAGIYIPALCYHPDLPPFDSGIPSKIVYQGSLRIEGTSEGYEGCQLCLVEVEGDGIKTSCNTPVKEGMIVHTKTPEIVKRRQKILAKILSKHPHACLLCPQKEGCDLKHCINNVPEDERCCSKFNNCELRKVAEYVGIRGPIPRYTTKDLPVVQDEPLFIRDYNLCIGCTRCVRICNDVRGVGALSFTRLNGEIIVGTIAPTLKDSGCRFCGACVEVCPTGALLDKGITRAERKTHLRLQISHPIMPPEELIEFNAKNLEDVPETEGVFKLFDGKKNLLYIKGTMNLFQELNEQLRNYKKARYFMWEEDPMFSKRESELLQQFVQQHGRLPEGNSELDDLY